MLSKVRKGGRKLGRPKSGRVGGLEGSLPKILFGQGTSKNQFEFPCRSFPDTLKTFSRNKMTPLLIFSSMSLLTRFKSC